MGEYSTDVPLLSSGEITLDFEKKKTSIFKTPAKWVLKVLMWVIFVAWISLMFFYPSEFISHLVTHYWINATNGTVFGMTGSLFFAFTAPILIIAFLAVLYLVISDEEEIQEKKTSKRPTFKLWTFPVIVNGPFGVVTAAEFIGIVLVFAFVMWACAAFTVQNWSELSKKQVTAFFKSCLMMEETGAKLGLIGLFFLSLLFIPISRGSVLLRLVDIPFEHATRYHVWLGHLTMVLFTLHGLLYVLAWIMEGRLIEQTFEWRDIGVANLAGVISLAAGILMWVTSLPGVRKWNFELFFYTHQLYIVFVVFFAMHVGDFIYLMGSGGIFLFMLDRFLRFIQSRKTVDVISATSLPCGTVELVLSKPACLRYNALSFIFLQVRELSLLQWHPFSVSSSPQEGKNHLTVLIKVLGEWTDKLKGKISNNHNEPQKLLESQLKSVLSASVEGPYGHESPYHLTYKRLVLVAGGIGISPFLAILSDVMHRLKDGKPCMPKDILIVWAIKNSDELPLLSMINLESVDPVFYDALNLDIQIYVTRQSEPKVEEGNAFGTMNMYTYPTSKRSAISVLVGTGDNIWSGIYVIASSIGFLIFMALLDGFYINPKGIYAWWYKGLLALICMLAGVFIFGGITVALWHLWERRMLASETNEQGTKKSNGVVHDVAVEHKNSNQEYLINASTLRYGCRPDFKDFDPSQIRRQKKPKNQRMKVRMMLPMTTRCSTCGNFIYKGTKFNSFKQTLIGETYLGIPMFRFYFKCTHCCAEIILNTDPKESDYTVEAGATRNFEPWRVQDEEVKKRDAEEVGDAIKALENKAFDSKWDMDSMAALDELKSMKSRRATISQGAMLDALQGMGVDKVKKLNEEDEALIGSIFNGPKQHVRRIDNEEWDDGNGVMEKDFVKKRKFSVDVRKPTDLLTKDIITNDSSSKGPSDDKSSIVWPPAFKVRSKRKPVQDPDNKEPVKQETRSKQQGKSVTRIALQSLCQYDCEDE